MKNDIIRDYLISINNFTEREMIKDISLSYYCAELAGYIVKFYDVNNGKNRQRSVIINLFNYHKFVEKLKRKEKLSNLNNV